MAAFKSIRSRTINQIKSRLRRKSRLTSNRAGGFTRIARCRCRPCFRNFRRDCLPARDKSAGTASRAREDRFAVHVSPHGRRRPGKRESRVDYLNNTTLRGSVKRQRHRARSVLSRAAVRRDRGLPFAIEEWVFAGHAERDAERLVDFRTEQAQVEVRASDRIHHPVVEVKPPRDLSRRSDGDAQVD